MKRIYFTLFGVCILFVTSQAQVKNYDFQQGEVMDVILLSQKQNFSKALDHYFISVIPLAMSLGYHPQQSYKINESPSAGNLHPEMMIIGKWASLKTRNEAVAKLKKDVNDFRELKSSIWSNFKLTYYELNERTRFQVDSRRYNVAVSYWIDEKKGNFYSELRAAVASSKGSLLLHLEDGDSPFGYHYRPDHFMILSWSSEQAYEEFKDLFSKLDACDLEQINEFIID